LPSSDSTTLNPWPFKKDSSSLLANLARTFATGPPQPLDVAAVTTIC